MAWSGLISLQHFGWWGVVQLLSLVCQMVLPEALVSTTKKYHFTRQQTHRPNPATGELFIPCKGNILQKFQSDRLPKVHFWCCGSFGECFLGGAPLYLQILKIYVGGQRHEPILTTGINNQMSYTKVQENHWVRPKRLLLLCIMSKLLLQVILKDPVWTKHDWVNKPPVSNNKNK